MLPDLIFLIFALGLLAGAGTVVAARNPMYCVLGMMFTFLNASGLFILFGAEFLGLLMVMIYVGAIAVMFLFVVMTIDLDFATLREGFAPYLPVGLLMIGVLAAQLLLAVWGGLGSGVGQGPAPIAQSAAAAAQPENIVALGQVLYTTYALPFQLAGLILLTAMIGAILLTFRPRGDARRQNIPAQIARTAEDSVTLTTPATGQGATTQHWQPKSVAQMVKEKK
jgi:NADH-quinone oxidoreductase subunit J